MINFGAIFGQMQEYKDIADNLRAGRTPLLATGLAEVHKAGLVAALADSFSSAVLITPDEASATKLAEELRSMLGEEAVLTYPAREYTLRDVESSSREYEHERLRVLGLISGGAQVVVVASAEAAVQHTLPPEELVGRSFTVKLGQGMGVQALLEQLLRAGYERCEQVEGRGQFAHRGGIVDFFPPHEPLPCRVEFWGDEVDGIAPFETGTQRRLDARTEIHITPAREVLFESPEQFAVQLDALIKQQRGRAAEPAKQRLTQLAERMRDGLMPASLDRFLHVIYPEPAVLADYLPGGAVSYISDPVGVREALRSAQALMAEDIKQLLDEGYLFRGCGEFLGDFNHILSGMVQRPTLVLDTFTRQFGDIPLAGLYPIQATQLAGWGGDLTTLLDDLRHYLRSGYGVAVATATAKGAQTLAFDLAEAGLPAAYREQVDRPPVGHVHVTAGGLSAGFELPTIKTAVIAHARAQTQVRKPAKKQRRGDAIKSLADLSSGDYVVHIAHGIGIFDGIVKREIHGVVKDYIKIRYAGTDALFVPVTQLDLVSKYIGAREDGALKLSKLNSTEWGRTKARVKSAVADMAAELIKLYAERMSAVGFAFTEDSDWQREFELRFPYDETDDQLRCIDEVKADMERPVPMDRLLCGDVGFGKTEVALRAAFKCVMDSKQCAVLVPTTILAWQHYQTFKSRMEGYPVRIELLSRFRTKKQQREVIADVKKGLVDIVIGTHRIIQKDMEFKNLGLCVVDEEQRFGVAHKERFKEQLASVDVLTLSATPIPRTLNMAMTGIRDMSVIDEAPVDRHPVQTYVVEHDWGVLTAAMQRELRRGGQVFYLHNRVDSILSCANRIQERMPDARIASAHGRMGEEELSDIWKKLVDHEIDILVCTTIIETGVDVPNCNTLIVENADNMGLSQLYQLRGRVGRSGRRAFAYFTFLRGKELTEIATKRLTAIKEFTSFGSGFRIAMRDLEIRGAGNVLGAQQHGHMEAVGYDMYLRLLAEAVGEQRGERPVRTSAECSIDLHIAAHIPERYIENLSQRIDVYKKIAAIQSQEDADDVLDELCDRFGDPPEAVLGLLEVALVRGRAAALGIREISQREEVVFFYPEALQPEQLAGLAAAMGGRVLVGAGAKPYFSVKVGRRQKPLDTVRETLNALEHQA